MVSQKESANNAEENKDKYNVEKQRKTLSPVKPSGVVVSRHEYVTDDNQISHDTEVVSHQQYFQTQKTDPSKFAPVDRKRDQEYFAKASKPFTKEEEERRLEVFKKTNLAFTKENSLKNSGYTNTVSLEAGPKRQVDTAAKTFALETEHLVDLGKERDNWYQTKQSLLEQKMGAFAERQNER